MVWGGEMSDSFARGAARWLLLACMLPVLGACTGDYSGEADAVSESADPNEDSGDGGETGDGGGDTAGDGGDDGTGGAGGGDGGAVADA